MKILFIADTTSIHTIRWISYFVDCGDDVYVITIGKKRKILPRVNHLINFEHFYYLNPIRFLKTLKKARTIVHSIKPDILHAHFGHQYGWLGALCGYHPFIMTLWGTDILVLPERSRTRLGMLLTKYAIMKADALTVTSSATKKAVISAGAEPEKVSIIFWGVDVNIFRPDIDFSFLKRKLNINKDATVVLSNRDFAPLYNNDVVLRAMSLVLRDFPKTVLILQNAGGWAERERSLRKLAEELGIISSVKFLPQYPHQDLPPLYAMADIYVSVPSSDASPVSLREAMASGCAPIISELCGPMEWVKHGENGLVVPVRDHEALANAICYLIKNEDKRIEFARKSRQIICERGSHIRQMQKARALYEKAIKFAESNAILR